MKKIFLILLLLFTIVSCELKKAQEAYDNKEYIRSIYLTLSYFEKHPNKVEKIKPDIKNEIMEKFSNIVNYYKTEAGSSNLEERQDGYEGLYKIYALFDVYSQSSNFTDFLSKYDGDELLGEIYKLIDERIKTRELEGKYSRDIISILDEYYRNMIGYTKELSEIKKIDENKILKYESISRKMSQAEADKLIEYANIKEKAEKYREAQKLNEAAQETYEQYQKNYKNLYIKIRELKKKADYQEADKLYQSAIQTSGAVTKHGYRESIEKLKKAQEIIPNFRDSKEKIAEYSKKAYVKYNISGCDNSHVPAYINGHLSKVGVYTKYSSEAEVQINCKVTDNYQVSTYPSQIKNLSQVKEVKNNDGQTVKKEFIFQESKTKSVEKLDFSYEIELSGYVKKKYSGNAYKQHEINSLQYLGNVPSEYSGKDKIEKLWGESEMRRKVYDSASFFKDLEDIVKELEKL